MTESRHSSAGKAIAILDTFGGPRSVLGISELALKVNLPKSTVHRLLGVLAERGYVRRVGDRYALSGRAFELGNQLKIARPNGLRDRAIPYMTELSAYTGETVHLAILAGTDILYIEKIYGHESTRCHTSVGTRRPAYATGLGKAMLAYAEPSDVERNRLTEYRRLTPYTISNSRGLDRALARVRDEGCATDFEESFPGLTCIAVPLVRPDTHTAVAALSVSKLAVGPSVTKFRERILRIARSLSAELMGLSA